MKFSISNIAWPAEHDEEMYGFIYDNGFSGLEIAPTRIFPNDPYDKLIEAKDFSNMLKEVFGLSVSSMQSIWYGITESIFGSDTDRQKLIDYSKKAVDFAHVIGCQNLVFGCPKNRDIPAGTAPDIYLPIAFEFFDKIGSYAAKEKVFVSIEPNPTIYNTNFINTTPGAFDICKELDNSGIKVNMDLGTVIYNGENIEFLKDNINLINHIHISEPYLAPIQKRTMHRELIEALKNLQYDKYVSIEMGNPNDIELVKKTILYMEEICHDV